MFRQWKAAHKARKRARELEGKLAELQGRCPDTNWAPFQEVTRFFAGKSMSALDEQAFLYQLCCQLPPDAQVVEIGSWIGHSACLIGLALRGPNARCFAIDAFTGLTAKPSEVDYYRRFLAKVSEHKNQRQLFDEHIAHFGLQKKVVPIAAESSQAAKLLPPDFSGADLVFIDGGHTLEVARADTELYIPLVKPGGVVVFHDFSSECGVPTAVWEAIQRGSFRDLIGIRCTLLAFRKL